MGAKGPSKLKLRRPTYKCKACSKKFLSTQALKTHLFCEHRLKRNKRLVNETNKITAIPETTVKHNENSGVTAEPNRKQEGETLVSESEQASCASNPSSKSYRKINFACSKCNRLFSNRITAHKHIERVHLNIKGEKSSSEIEEVKMELVESCMICYNRIDPDKTHTCGTAVVDLAYFKLFLCTGCNQQFKTVQHFDAHVTSLHGDGIESLFFPTYAEFDNWKGVMEKDTMVKYSALSKNKFKQTYRCMFIPKNDDPGAVYFCPSSIMIREYSKGLQVHFYQQHHGHSFTEYCTPDSFKQYTINEALLKPPIDFAPFDIGEENDLYVQFRKLMYTIVVDSAKLNIEMLKVLISKAFEMTAILNAYDEDETDIIPKSVANRSMTDEEIFKALKFFMETATYKYNSSVDTAQEKPETVGDTPKILNTFSLADNREVKPEPISDTPQMPNTRTLRKSARFREEPTKVVVPVNVTSQAVTTVVSAASKTMPTSSGSNRSSLTRPIILTRNVGTPVETKHIAVSTLTPPTVASTTVAPTTVTLTPTPMASTTANKKTPNAHPVASTPANKKTPNAHPVASTPANKKTPNAHPVASTPANKKTPNAHPVASTTANKKTPNAQPVASATANKKTPNAHPVASATANKKAPNAHPVASATANKKAPNAHLRNTLKIDSKLFDAVKKGTAAAPLVSFNDSYKDFVDKNFKVDTSAKKANSSAGDAPNKSASVVPNVVNVISKPNAERLVANDKMAAKKVLRNEYAMADSVNVIGMRGVDNKILRKVLSRNSKGRRKDSRKGKFKLQPKKGIVKTKIGQYKPIVSPKKPNTDFAKPKAVSAVRSSSCETKAKVEVKYEVMEQDNDCNILILKI